MDDRYEYFPAYRFGTDIPPEPLAWLWPARIPLGAVTLLVGDPGTGKSLFAADLVARASAGLPWPDAPPPPRSNSSPHLGVVLAAPEDPADTTLLPRLTAAGADLNRICILEGVAPYISGRRPADADERGLPPPEPLQLPEHMEMLEAAVRTLDFPRLVVLDPLSALLSPAAGAGPAALQALAGLADIAYRKQVAIVAVGHLAKGRSHRMLYRVRGSLSFVAAARAVFLLSLDPENSNRRVLTTLKSVYGPPAPPLAFSIDPGPKLRWEAPAGACSGPTVLDSSPDLTDLSIDAYSALAEACDWLTEYLKDGPQPARQVLRTAQSAGLSRGTLLRAKRVLAIRSFHRPDDATWIWSLSHNRDTITAQPRSARR